MSLPTTLEAGQVLDHYRIDEAVAESGMASIYRATDLRNSRQVALKVPHFAMESDPALFDRFQREEDIGTRMEHPGVMKVFANPGRSQVYMVMEWVEGRLLRQIMNEQGKLPVERAVKLTVAICHALEYIHANGVVHRDLKPENVMVDADDNIRLIDFGIAGSAGARRLTFANFSRNMGTPDYISPEQVKGKRGDARSDVYSLGVILYEMLAGRVPFSGPNPFAVMNDRLLNPPPPPRGIEPSITPQLQEILYRALERDPKNRYASARELAHDLEHQDQVGVANRPEVEGWQKRKSPGVRRGLMYAGLVLVPVILFAVLLWVARRH